MSWKVRRRLEGEKVTVAEILGGGVAEFSREGGGLEDCEGEDGLGLGAKKREMTCCFCFPMEEESVSGPIKPSP